MRHPLRWIATALLAVAVLPIAALAANVTIKNKSEWAIQHFFLSPVEQDKWGADQLGDEVIGTNDQFTLTGVPCDEYDVKLVDEDGDECVVAGVDICSENQGWVINNDDLLACEAEGEEED